MKTGKILMAMGAVIGLVSSTAAMAAQTRSGSALPSSQSLATAPIHGVRHAATLRNASMQSDSSASTGAYVAAGLAAAIVIAGVVVAVSDNNNNNNNAPDSTG